MAASNVCCICSVISMDFRSPLGRVFLSPEIIQQILKLSPYLYSYSERMENVGNDLPVLKVAMLYWQFTKTLSCKAFVLEPVICKIIIMLLNMSYAKHNEFSYGHPKIKQTLLLLTVSILYIYIV